MKSYRTYLFDFVQQSYYSPSVHSIWRLLVGKTTLPLIAPKGTSKVWPPTSPHSHTQSTMYIDIEQENIIFKLFFCFSKYLYFKHLYKCLAFHLSVLKSGHFTFTGSNRLWVLLLSKGRVFLMKDTKFLSLPFPLSVKSNNLNAFTIKLHTIVASLLPTSCYDTNI